MIYQQLKKICLHFLWRLAKTWHYLAAIAVGLLITIFVSNLEIELAVLLFIGLTVCFALLNTPLEPLKGTLQNKQKKRDKRNSNKDKTILPHLIGAMSDPLIILGKNAELIHANQRAQRLFSITTMGQHISALIRDPDFLSAVTLVFENKTHTNVNYLERVPVERHYAVNIAWIAPNANRKGPAALIHFRDLTEQEQLNNMRSDFIANASHELRTPLTSLLGFIETLQGPAKNDPAAQEKFLDVMAKQGKRMVRLIDDLLSLSRVEMSLHTIRNEQVNVTNLLSNVIDSLTPLAKQQNITLDYKKTQEDLITTGDHDELVQLFQNLIHNAIKYGRENGHVTIKLGQKLITHQNKKRLIIVIEDDGIGIAREHIPRITERFYRVDIEASHQKGGTGLGLAIAKHIINHHRGELKIQSEEGKGSTFTIELPGAE